MDTVNLIAFCLDIAILFTKFYKLGKVNVMLDEADASIICMKEYNKVMKIEQKEAEEFLDNVQDYWLEQRKVTWLEIYLLYQPLAVYLEVYMLKFKDWLLLFHGVVPDKDSKRYEIEYMTYIHKYYDLIKGF